ncbi:hypothetical protein BJ165DRAFT_1518903 [Panaeolus papilionaceus]|nr:hypothetical protein BJ165DRAFT_1518903 [Panaeolus papilionaceus]
MQNALLHTVGVYLKGLAGSLGSSNMMTPPRSSRFHLLSIEVIQLVLSYCQVNDAAMVARRKYSKLCDSEFLDCTPTSFCVASRLSVSFYRIARSMIYKNVHIEIPVYSKSLLQNAESDVDSCDADEHSFLDEPPTCDRDVVIGSFTPRLQDLCDIFFLNDSIVYDIHHVKVSFKRYEFIEEFDPAEHAADSDPTVSMLQYLARHQKIRSISIRGITHALEDTERVDGMERERDGMDWRTLPSEMQCSLSHLLQCPTLEKVELINWSHFPLSRLWLNGERISQSHYTLYPIPRPKNIAFTLHHVSDDPSLADPTPLEPTMEQPELLSILPPNPISITSLRLVQPTVGWSHTTACLLGTIVSRGVVESQHVQVQPRNKAAHPARLDAIRDLAIAIKDPRDGCIAMLLAECGANLETLELDVRSGWMRTLRKADDLTQLPTLDLSHLHSLHELMFRISPETPIAWISALLKTLPPRDDTVSGPFPSSYHDTPLNRRGCRERKCYGHRLPH